MTAAELMNLWHARDELYSRRRSELSDEAISAVQWWRLKEVDTLEPKERAAAWAQAQSWAPPLMVRR